MQTYPGVDESRDRLRRAGWSVGDSGGDTLWVVTGSNGGDRLDAEGRNRAEAWWRACKNAGRVELTEREWLECADPTPMLDSLAGDTGRRVRPCNCCRNSCTLRPGVCPLYRRLRLFACACSRRLPRMTEPIAGNAVASAERYVEGRLPEVESRQAGRVFDFRNSSAFRGFVVNPGPDDGKVAVHYATIGKWESYFDGDGAIPRFQFASNCARAATYNSGPGEPGVQAELLRDVFGDAGRPESLPAAWRTADAVSLALAALEERAMPSGELDLERLAVLSDALEETGCDEGILVHLRSPGPHVLGCWALDLVLGKG